jgi:hypothetical protein
MTRFTRKLSKIRGNTFGAIVTFFRAGRSVSLLVAGVILGVLGVCVLYASFGSQEVLASSGGWNTFVAAAGTNQWMSATFLISSGFVILSINYLPRLEGEA